jgi:hypothetical protein
MSVTPRGGASHRPPLSAKSGCSDTPRGLPRQAELGDSNDMAARLTALVRHLGRSAARDCQRSSMDKSRTTATACQQEERDA